VNRVTQIGNARD